MRRLALAFLALVLAACAGSQPRAVPPDERFGHRYEADSPDGRSTLVITAPDADSYFYYPAAFDTLHVRPAPFTAGSPSEGQQVPVEVLVKGALPDACMELHAVRQQRAGHLIDVELEMRRPEGAVCAAVVRPYRFYFLLDGLYGVGSYTLKVNGTVHPFEIRVPERTS